MSQVRVEADADGVRFTVKVVPGASRTRVVGVLGEALRVAVAAAPQRGQANEALCRFLASLLGVRRSDVSIRSGHGRPVKQIVVRGSDAARVARRIGEALAEH